MVNFVFPLNAEITLPYTDADSRSDCTTHIKRMRPEQTRVAYALERRRQVRKGRGAGSVGAVEWLYGCFPLGRDIFAVYHLAQSGQHHLNICAQREMIHIPDIQFKLLLP